MKYQVSNTREESVVVDGLGVLSAHQTLEIDHDSETDRQFFGMRGLTLAQAGLPAGVEVLIDLDA